MEPTDILVVDDSPMIVKLIIKFLLNNGIKGHHFEADHIYTANDGMEAFDMLSTKPHIKFIISDVNMPMLNGDELLEILIDTGKLASMEVILITNKETSQRLSSLTRKNILGVIHKPFNKDSFPQAFNELLDEKQKRLEQAVVVKKENQEKVKLMGDVLKEYLEKEELPVDTKLLGVCVNEQLDLDSPIMGSEMLSLMLIMIHDYYEKAQLDAKVNEDHIRKIFAHAVQPQRTYTEKYPYNLLGTFKHTLESVATELNSGTKMEDDAIIAKIFADLEDTASIIVSKVKKYSRKDVLLYEPYFEQIIEELSAMDPNVNTYELQKLRAELAELIAFHKWMRNFYQTAELFTQIPSLKTNSAVVNECNSKIQAVFKQISAAILHYTGAVDKMIWNRAKASAMVLKFLRKELPKKIPGTKNYLMYKERLDRSRIKEYENYERETVIIISNYLETLQEVKNKQEEFFPLWSMLGFSNAKIVESWLKGNRPTKIVMDYDFKTPTFKNGLQYLAHLGKNYPQVKDILDEDHIYLLSSNAKLAEVREEKRGMEFSLISKPLREYEIRNTFLYS